MKGYVYVLDGLRSQFKFDFVQVKYFFSLRLTTQEYVKLVVLVLFGKILFLAPLKNLPSPVSCQFDLYAGHEKLSDVALSLVGLDEAGDSGQVCDAELADTHDQSFLFAFCPCCDDTFCFKLFDLDLLYLKEPLLYTFVSLWQLTL